MTPNLSARSTGAASGGKTDAKVGVGGAGVGMGGASGGGLRSVTESNRVGAAGEKTEEEKEEANTLPFGDHERACNCPCVDGGFSIHTQVPMVVWDG